MFNTRTITTNMTNKEKYAQFVKNWTLTHSISKVPNYRSFLAYYNN